MTHAKEDMIEISKSDLDRWIAAKIETEPNLISTCQGWLTLFRKTYGNQGVREAGMQALRRAGGVNKKVSIAGRKLNLWTLDTQMKDELPHVWNPQSTRVSRSPMHGKWSMQFQLVPAKCLFELTRNQGTINLP